MKFPILEPLPGLSVAVAMVVMPGELRADKIDLMSPRLPHASDVKRFRTKSPVPGERPPTLPPPQRIVGGGNSAPLEYPWMVAVVDSKQPDNYLGQFCAGTLIHPYWVLSAAHCYLGSDPADVEVVAAVTDLANDPSPQRIAVAEIIPHPLFNVITSEHDVALLRLASPATAPAVALPLIDDPALADPGVTATIIGWGATETQYPEILQKAQVPIVPLETANATLTYDGTLTGNMLPAGFAAGGADTCQGDSGGPLLVPSPIAPGWMIAGVVSFGDACGQPEAYGIYTRLTEYRDFILQHVSPAYAAWERATGMLGEFRDGDGNGWLNWQEAATGSKRPLFIAWGDGSDRSPAVLLQRPVPSDEFQYLVDRSGDLGAAMPWIPVPLPASIVYTTPLAGDPPHEQVVIAPDGATIEGADADFLRTTIGRSNRLVLTGSRPLGFPGSAAGSLTPEDPLHPDLPGRRAKLYDLGTLTPGVTCGISVRSRRFDTRAEVIDATDGSVVQVAQGATGNGQLGTDEVFEFTPGTSGPWQLRVTSESAGATGTFGVAAWRVDQLAAVPTVAVPQSVNSSLGAGDEFDPIFLPGRSYYKEDYLLDTATLPAGQPVQIELSSGGFDTFVEVLNAETNSLIFWDDDSGSGSDSRVQFVPVPGGPPYLIRATSSGELETGPFSLTTLVPDASALPTIGLNQVVNGSLATTDPEDPNYPGYYKDDYLLAAGTAGQKVRVTMSSTVVDAYLFVLDASDLSLVDADDSNGPPGGVDNAELELVLEPGSRYFIRASSYSSYETGAYTLTTAVVP